MQRNKLDRVKSLLIIIYHHMIFSIFIFFLRFEVRLPVYSRMFIYILLLKMSIVFDPYCFSETSLVFSAFFEEPSMPMTLLWFTLWILSVKFHQNGSAWTHLSQSHCLTQFSLLQFCLHLSKLMWLSPWHSLPFWKTSAKRHLSLF